MGEWWGETGSLATSNSGAGRKGQSDSTAATSDVGTFPVAVPGWRIEADRHDATIEYRHNVRVGYSSENLSEIVSSGNALFRRADGLDAALFQYQEHEFRKLKPQQEYIIGDEKRIPFLSKEMGWDEHIWAPSRPTNVRRLHLLAVEDSHIGPPGQKKSYRNCCMV